MKEELKTIAENWNASGEFDGTDFEGRYFINDADLDEFAAKYGLGRNDDDGGFDAEKIENKCACQIISDYEGANPNRQFEDSEVIFND